MIPLTLCLPNLRPLAQCSLLLSLWVYLIVWVETSVLESEQVPTSCNLFHNQYLYKCSALTLQHCQIVSSAQSVWISSCLFLRVILRCLFSLAWRCFSLRYSSFRSDSGPCHQSLVSSVLLPCTGPHSTASLDSALALRPLPRLRVPPRQHYVQNKLRTSRINKQNRLVMSW